MSTTIALDKEFEEQLEFLVSTGHYSNAKEAVQRAIDLLVEQEQIEHLRALIKVGMDEEERGEVFEYTPELRKQMREEARRLARSGEALDPDVIP